MKTTFTIGHYPIIDHVILGIAQQKDGAYYEHLELKAQLFFNWESMIEALDSGEIQGAFMLAPLAMELFDQGMDIRAVLLGQREGQVVVAQSHHTTPQDLKGTRMLVPHKYSMHHVLLHRILKQAGLDITKDITLHHGPDDIRKINEALEKKEIDGFVSAEPWGTIAEDKGAGKMMAFSKTVHTHHLCCVLVMRRDVIKQHRDAVQEFVESLVRAGMFINAYPRQASELGADFMHVSKKLAIKALTHHEGHVLFWDLLPRIEDFEEVLAIGKNEMDLWDHDIDLSTFIDSSFAQEAYRTWMLDTRREVKDRGTDRTLPGNMAQSVRQLSTMIGNVAASGLRFIRPGEKYPKEVKRIKQIPGLYSEFLQDVFAGDEYIVASQSKNVKGFTLVNTSRAMEADRILLQLTHTQAQHCLQALQWGNASETITNYRDETAELDVINTKSPYIFLRHNDVVWASISYEAFRFLPLLIARF